MKHKADVLICSTGKCPARQVSILLGALALLSPEHQSKENCLPFSRFAYTHSRPTYQAVLHQDLPGAASLQHFTLSDGPHLNHTVPISSDIKHHCPLLICSVLNRPDWIVLAEKASRSVHSSNWGSSGGSADSQTLQTSSTSHSQHPLLSCHDKILPLRSNSGYLHDSVEVTGGIHTSEGYCWKNKVREKQLPFQHVPGQRTCLSLGARKDLGIFWFRGTQQDCTTSSC